MGTPCYIAEKKKDGRYRSIYCQMGGTPDEVGELLIKHYDTSEKLDALLALGDIYSLGERVTPDPSQPHCREDGYQNGVTVAFGRDRDSPGFEAKDRTLDELMDGEEPVEFLYVHTPGHEWEVCALLDYNAQFRKVGELLAEQKEDHPIVPSFENGQTM